MWDSLLSTQSEVIWVLLNYSSKPVGRCEFGSVLHYERWKWNTWLIFNPCEPSTRCAHQVNHLFSVFLSQWWSYKSTFISQFHGTKTRITCSQEYMVCITDQRGLLIPVGREESGFCQLDMSLQGLFVLLVNFHQTLVTLCQWRHVFLWWGELTPHHITNPLSTGVVGGSTVYSSDAVDCCFFRWFSPNGISVLWPPTLDGEVCSRVKRLGWRSAPQNLRSWFSAGRGLSALSHQPLPTRPR